MTQTSQDQAVGSGYVFDNTLARARDRMAAAEEFLDPWTTLELERVGIQDEWQCLELGAGTGSIAAWLCRRVGAHGRVVATDIDTRFIEQVKGYPNLEVWQHDLTKDPLSYCENLWKSAAGLEPVKG